MSLQQEMPAQEPIVNKVAESGIITLDLSVFVPDQASVLIFDIKPLLFMEMILREKDFRSGLQAIDWSEYTGKHVGINCSVDAVIPVWAYMLIATYLQPFAVSIHFSGASDLMKLIIATEITKLDISSFTDKRVVLKGCGDVHIPEEAYVAATARLRPVVKSLMYGEPCSTVPVFKKRPIDK